MQLTVYTKPLTEGFVRPKSPTELSVEKVYYAGRNGNDGVWKEIMNNYIIAIQSDDFEKSKALLLVRFTEAYLSQTNVGNIFKIGCNIDTLNAFDAEIKQVFESAGIAASFFTCEETEDFDYHSFNVGGSKKFDPLYKRGG